VVFEIGIGLELYKWAADRGMEIPLLIFLLILLILLIIIAANLKGDSDSDSLCRDCMYERQHAGNTFTCGFYKHKPLFMRKRLKCPTDQLFRNTQIHPR